MTDEAGEPTVEDSALPPPEPPPTQRRLPSWPFLLCIMGWLILAFVPIWIPGGPGLLDPATWSVSSLIAAVLTMAYMRWQRPRLRVVLLATYALIGAARAIAYITGGQVRPLGVWFIVGGLVCALAMRGHPHRGEGR